MKKQFFLSALFAIMATFAMAQTPTLLPLDIDTNAITTHSFNVSAQAFGGGTGNWYVQVQAKKVGTTTWLNSDTAMYSGTGVQITRTKDSLLANTDYEPRLVVYNSALVQVSTVTFPVIRTKPLPQPVALASAVSVGMLPHSGLRFTGASSVGQQAFALGYPTAGGASVTDTVFFGFSSSFSDTLLFLVDGPNYFHPSTRVVIQGLSDGSVASVIVPAFTSPAYTAATMNFGTPTITKDSIRVNLNVTSLGNAGNPFLEVLIKDSVSGLFIYQTLQTLTATGPIAAAKGNLLSNHWYILQALATTPQNTTTVVTLPFKTLNVDPATVTVSQQLPQDYTTYTAKAFINPKGTGDSSQVTYVELLEGNTVVNSTVLALNDTGTIVFTQTGQTPGTTKSIKARVTNRAGLTTTSAVINVSMLAVGTPIMNISSSGKTIDSVYAKFNITGLGIPLNPTFHVVIKNSAGVTLLDSTRLVTSTGIISIGKGGLVSNTDYTITATLSNSMGLGDTDVVVITTNLPAQNPAPTFIDLFADDAATLRMTGISYSVSAGNIANVRALRKSLMTAVADTFALITGATSSGTIPQFILNNCIGSDMYEVTLFIDGLTGRVIGTKRSQGTPPPANVALANIVRDDNLTTTTTLAVTILGSGEGNASPTLKLWLYKNNVQVGTMFPATVNSGTFSYPYSWNNLDPWTEYKVVAELSAPGSAPASLTQYLNTYSILGIKSIPPIDETQMVQVCNLMGQVISCGEYRKEHESLIGSQATYLFTPIGDDGLVSGSTRKLFVQ